MALEMLFGLGLESLGQSPRIAAKLAKEIKHRVQDGKVTYRGSDAMSMRSSSHQILAPRAYSLHIAPSGFDKPETFRRGNVPVEALPAAFSALNLTVLAEKFEDAWLAEQT